MSDKSGKSLSIKLDTSQTRRSTRRSLRNELSREHVSVFIPQLIDLAFGFPDTGNVNFRMLHVMMHVFVEELKLVRSQVVFEIPHRMSLDNILPELPEQNIFIVDKGFQPDIGGKILLVRDYDDKKSHGSASGSVKGKGHASNKSQGSVSGVESGSVKGKDSSSNHESEPGMETEGSIKSKSSGTGSAGTKSIGSKSTGSSKSGKSPNELRSDRSFEVKAEGKEEIKAEINELRNQLNRLHETVNALLVALQGSNIDIKTDIKTNMMAEMDHGSGDHSIEINKLKDELNKIKEKLETDNTQMMEKRICQLERKLANALDIFAELEQDLCGLLEDNERKQKELAKKLENINEIVGGIKELRDDLENLNSRIDCVAQKGDDMCEHIWNINQTMDSLGEGKIDKTEVDELMQEKADVSMLQRKASLGQLETVKRAIECYSADSKKRMDEFEECCSDCILDIEERLDNKVDTEQLAEFIEKQKERMMDLSKNFMEVVQGKNNQEAAGSKLKKVIRDIECISCNRGAIMTTQTSKFPPFPPTRPGRAILLERLDCLKAENKLLARSRNLNHFEAIYKKGLIMDDVGKKMVNRYCGGSHTIITPQDRITHILCDKKPKNDKTTNRLLCECQGKGKIKEKGKEKEESKNGESKKEAGLDSQDQQKKQDLKENASMKIGSEGSVKREGGGSVKMDKDSLDPTKETSTDVSKLKNSQKGEVDGKILTSEKVEANGQSSDEKTHKDEALELD